MGLFIENLSLSKTGKEYCCVQQELLDFVHRQE